MHPAVAVRLDALVSRAGASANLGSPGGTLQDWDFAGAALLEPPLAVEARLPPLHPKRSSHLTMLATGHGCLFAGADTCCPAGMMRIILMWYSQ